MSGDRSYRWDFTRKRLSRRKGGRMALVSRSTGEVLEWIDPADQGECLRQYMAEARRWAESELSRPARDVGLLR